eukprot:878927_1
MMIHAGRLRLDRVAIVMCIYGGHESDMCGGAFTGLTATGVAKAKVLSKRLRISIQVKNATHALWTSSINPPINPENFTVFSAYQNNGMSPQKWVILEAV